MATSGYRDAWVTNYDTLRFSWSRSSYSIENNTSTISWSLLLISGSYGAISSSSSKAWNVNVNGTNYSGNTTIGIGNNTTKTLASGSTTIAHNADGTKDFAYSFSQYFGITFSGSSIGTVSGSSSGTLDTIPRSASITEAPDFNDETTNLTIKFNNPGNFDLKLKIEAGGDNALIVRDKVTKTSPYTFVLTDAEKKKLRQKCAKNTLNVRFTVATYINGTESEWSWLDRIMTLINYTPTLNPTVVNQYTTLTGDSNKIIRYYNACNAVSNATARKEATIQSIKITCGGKSRTSDGILSNVDNGTFVFSVTDSRGYTTSKTITKTLIDYVPLTCNFSSNSDLVEGSTANINILISGTYFSGSFGTVTNSLTVEYRYKTNDGAYGTWAPLTYTISDGKYTAQATIKNIFYTNSYTFQARAKDAIYTSGVTTQEQIVKIVPVFDWGKNDFKFNVPVYAPFISGYGGTLLPDGNWSDKNYWIALSNGLYWYDHAYTGYTIGSAGSMPYNWGFVEKIGNDANFSAIFYTQPTGLIYRLSGNLNQFYGWHTLALESYPINSIFIMYSHDSPASIIGGTWTRIENRFLWGCDGYGNIGGTGGEYSHTLTVDEMPSHHHYAFSTSVNTTIHDTYADRYPYEAWTNNYNEIWTGSVGGNQPHNNIPPFIMVSIWRRTA